MKDLKILTDVIFHETAQKSFRFPITNPVRISFWFTGADFSTFSEIAQQDKALELLTPCQVTIKIIERDFLKNKVKEGVEFKLGTFPFETASGKILRVEEI
jgi:hypothetical protein